MKRRLAVVGLAASLVLVFPVAAVAGEHSNGNHGAIWSLDVPEHGYDHGSEWGPAIKAWATGEAKDGGVSCGVHLAKGHNHMCGG